MIKHLIIAFDARYAFNMSTLRFRSNCLIIRHLRHRLMTLISKKNTNVMKILFTNVRLYLFQTN